MIVVHDFGGSGCPRNPQPSEDHTLRKHGSRTIQEHVAHRASARREEGLVPFVQAGDEQSHQKRVNTPHPGPRRIPPRRNRRAPGPEQQDAENTVSENVSAFAQEKVPGLKVDGIHSE